MAAILKADTLQNAASSVANLTLDTSGNVTGGGTIADSTAVIRPLVSGTSWTYSSGTPASIDFTGIPSWVKRIVVSLNGVSYAAAGQGVVRIGSGSLSTSGYTSNTNNFTTVPGISTAAQTNGFGSLATAAAASTIIGTIILTSDGSNTWSYSLMFFRTTDLVATTGTGSITLGGALDRFSLVATTSTFDAGTVYYTYE